MWLYVPSTDSRSAPASEGSTSESSSPSPDIELSVTSSGKPTPRPISWRGWKRRPWLRLLYGTISNPSMAAHGVESWISSLAASRAHPSALPASDSAPMIRAGSGRTSSGSLGRFDRDGSFSRTRLELFATDEPSDLSSVDWPRSGTMLDGVVSARATLARPMIGRGSGYSPDYPTPSAVSYGRNKGGQDPEGPERPSLETWSKSWPTPTAMSGGPESAERKQELGRDGGSDLQATAKSWPSPRAEDSESAGNYPDAMDSLTGVAKDWATPTSHERTHTPRDVDHGEQLANQTAGWPTPRTMDAQGADYQYSRGDPTKPVMALGGMARSFPHPETTCEHGAESCAPVLTLLRACPAKDRRLNPRFGAWLMGLPSGWTIARTGSGPSATASYLWWQRMRSWLSQIAPDG